MTKPFCIYHGGCDDGFAAAWVVRKALGDVEFYPGVYSKEPPDVTGRDVILVDFSYKRHVLQEMFRKANSILILDHHKTAAEDLAVSSEQGGFRNVFGPGWQRHLDNVAQDTMENCPAIYVQFDMERSGAAMAWDFFMGGERPPFIDYVQDRDLWRKQLPHGDEFSIALRSYPQDFAVWDGLVENMSNLIEEGAAIQRYYRLRIEELKRSAYMALFPAVGASCLVTNAPYFAASEVAGELAERGSFGACYFEVEKGRYQYSLRSRGDFDVSALAREYGGGGHKNAAGFVVDSPVHVGT